MLRYFFAYLRLEHLQRVIAALLENQRRSRRSSLFFLMAPSSDQCDEINAVRAYVNQLTGFKSVKLITREANFGLQSRSLRAFHSP